MSLIGKENFFLLSTPSYSNLEDKGKSEYSCITQQQFMAVYKSQRRVLALLMAKQNLTNVEIPTTR